MFRIQRLQNVPVIPQSSMTRGDRHETVPKLKQIIKDNESRAAWKPSKRQLLKAYGKRVPDVIALGLRILFCGINPGLYSAAVGHHFARPGNRFWPALYSAGFTRRRLSPFEERELLREGLGITNLVARATAAAEELVAEELSQGAANLRRKVLRYKPAVVAFLGVAAYRKAFGRPHAKLGRQQESLGNAVIWLLPNPSGLNANYQLVQLTRLFRELKNAARKLRPGRLSPQPPPLV
jgi:TDG/mug DNA glycosylase family protein